MQTTATETTIEELERAGRVIEAAERRVELAYLTGQAEEEVEFESQALDCAISEWRNLAASLS